MFDCEDTNFGFNNLEVQNFNVLYLGSLIDGRPYLRCMAQSQKALPGFVNFWHGPVRENQSTPLKGSKIAKFESDTS